MAIIQISQIRHRRGDVDDFKAMKNLEEGEIGVILEGDSTNPGGTVFIGTPDLPAAQARSQSSAFPFGNTQILTEWSKNVEELLKYTYLYRSEVDYIVNNGALGQYNITNVSASARFIFTNSTVPRAKSTFRYFDSNWSGGVDVEIRRHLQEKLDERVSVKDYGARGKYPFDVNLIPTSAYADDMKSETYAIRRAAVDVANVTNKDAIANDINYAPRALYFPSGVYAIDDFIVLPPNSTWIGDGKEKTIISLRGDKEVVWGENDCLLLTVNGDLQPEDVYSDADVLSYTYQNITPTSGGFLPENIIISGITFKVEKESGNPAVPMDIVRLFGGRNITFYDCAFEGTWTTMPGDSEDEVKAFLSGQANYVSSRQYFTYYPGDVGDPSQFGDIVAVVVDSGGTIENKPHNINFVRCDFSKTTYASILTDTMRDINYYECSFNQHYRAIAINESIIDGGTPLADSTYFIKTLTGTSITQVETSAIPTSFIGPRNIKVSFSNFNNVMAEAISVRCLNTKSARDNSTTEFFKSGRVLSIGNRFENIGNLDTNNGSLDYDASFTITPYYPVINFAPNTQFNISVGDLFSRDYVFEKVNGIYAHEGAYGTPTIFNTYTSGVSTVPSNSVPRIAYSTLDDNIIVNPTDFFTEPTRFRILTSGKTFLEFSSEANTVQIDYSIAMYDPTDQIVLDKRRIGRLELISDGKGNTNIDDEYTEVGGYMNVQFYVSASPTTGNMELRYSPNVLEGEARFFYDIDYTNTKSGQ